MNNTFAQFNQQNPFGNATFDPSALQFPQNTHIDPSQFANPQLLQQHLGDSANRGQSPGFQQQQQPSYQTNPLIPAKRPRPGEDGSNMSSPRPPPGASRSQTPQQQQPQQNNINPMAAFGGQPHMQAMNHFQHMQQPGSGHPSPSPVMQNQFRSPMNSHPQQQQLQSASPSQFQAMGRPPPGTPQGMNGMPNTSTPQQGLAFNGPGMMGTPTPNPAMMSQLHEQSQMYRQQLQKQQQQLQSQAMNMQGRQPQQQQQSQQQQMPTSNNQSPQKPNAASLPGQGQQAQGRNQDQKAQFISSFQNFCKNRGFQLNPRPQVCGRNVDYFAMFMYASQLHIFQPGPNRGNWNLMAETMGFPPAQNPSAPQELKMVFEQNHMTEFMFNWMQTIQKRRMMAQQQQQQQRAGSISSQQGSPTQPVFPGMPQQQQTQQQPQQQPQMLQQTPQPQQQQQQRQQQQQTPQQVMPQQQQQPPQQPQPQSQQLQQKMAQAQQAQQQPQKRPAQQQQPQPQQQPLQQQQQPQPGPQMPTPGQFPQPQSQGTPQNRTPSQRHTPLPGAVNGNSQAPNVFQTPPPQINSRQGSVPTPGPSLPNDQFKQSPSIKNEENPLKIQQQAQPIKGPAPELKRGFDLPGELFWSAYDLDTLPETARQIEHMREELDVELIGVSDLHALTMSLESGIDTEIRYALDQLVFLTSDIFQIRHNDRYRRIVLAECYDLIETIIDRAEEDLEALSSASSEHLDTFTLEPFNELRHRCHLADHKLQEVFKFADDKQELEKHVDRIDAVLVILRNLSESERTPRGKRSNREILASAPIVRFITSLIKKVGTRKQLLLKDQNTFEVMKDLIHFLANIAADVKLATEEDALYILHFLLAFSPPVLTNSESGGVEFEPPNDDFHVYLPSAIEAMAKILARDEPNRTWYKLIFSSETTGQPHELLTRAFSLAISPIPDFSRGFFTRSKLRPGMNGMGPTGPPDGLRLKDREVVQMRKPFLALGMLAADILASLTPGSEDPLALSWLESGDGWAVGVLRMVLVLSDHEAFVPVQSHHHGQVRAHLMRDDEQGFGLITQRALAMLSKLVERVDFSDSGTNGVTKKRTLADILPVESVMLDVLKSETFDPESLKRMLMLSRMER